MCQNQTKVRNKTMEEEKVEVMQEITDENFVEVFEEEV